MPRVGDKHFPYTAAGYAAAARAKKARGYQTGGSVGMSNPFLQIPPFTGRFDPPPAPTAQPGYTAPQPPRIPSNWDKLFKTAKPTPPPSRIPRPEPVGSLPFGRQYVDDPELNALYNDLQMTIMQGGGIIPLTPEQAAASSELKKELEQQIIAAGGKPYQYFTRLPHGAFKEGEGLRPGYDPMTGTDRENFTPPAIPNNLPRPELPDLFGAERTPDFTNPPAPPPEMGSKGPVEVHYSCFVAGTPIDMADGSSKNIEDIIVDDEVNTQDGSLDTVTFVHDIPEALRTLVTINDRITCTDSHPFLTEDGWKSCNPEASKPTYEEYDIEIGQLTVGDNLVTVNGLEEVTELISREELAKVYNFTTDKTHTYLVDGVVAHNKQTQTVNPDGTGGPKMPTPPPSTGTAGYEARINELIALGMTPEQAVAHNQSAVDQGGDLNNDGFVTNKEWQQFKNPQAGRDMSPKRPGEDWFAYHERVGTTQQQGDAAREAAAADNFPTPDADGRYTFNHPTYGPITGLTRSGYQQMVAEVAGDQAQSRAAAKEAARVDNANWLVKMGHAPDFDTAYAMATSDTGQAQPTPLPTEVAPPPPPPRILAGAPPPPPPPPPIFQNLMRGQMYANQPSATADMTTMQNPYVFGGYGAPPSMPYAGMATPQIPSIMGMAPQAYYGGSAQPVGMADPTQRVS